jgi:hypothetical protein
VRQVAPDITPVNEIGENAFHFVQVNWHAQPLEGICNVIERDLVLVENIMHTLEEIPVGDSLAFFQKEVGSLAIDVAVPVDVVVVDARESVSVRESSQYNKKEML